MLNRLQFTVILYLICKCVTASDLTFISGGQTGVDRGAADAAIMCNIKYGGFIPKYRQAEDGVVPFIYTKFIENNSESYAVRTRQNVDISHGLLVLLGTESAVGGTLLSEEYAKQRKKPVLVLQLDHKAEDNLNILNRWINQNKLEIINISGPRQSESKGIYVQAYSLLYEYCSGIKNKSLK